MTEQQLEKNFRSWTGHNLSKAERAAILSNKKCISNLKVASEVFAPGHQQIRAEWIIELASIPEPCRRESYVEWLITEKFDWNRFELLERVRKRTVRRRKCS